MNYVMIFIGGGVGSIMRYAVQMLLHERIAAYHFPWATFSTFSNDNLELLRHGHWALCFLYVALSVIFGIAACLLGSSLAKSGV